MKLNRTNLSAIFIIVLFNSCATPEIQNYTLSVKPSFKDFNITSQRSLIQYNNLETDSIINFHYSISDRFCDLIIEENLNPKEQIIGEESRIDIPNLMEGTYTILINATTKKGAHFQDKLYFTIHSDTMLISNLENFETRFKIVDTSTQSINDNLRDIEIELFTLEHKKYTLSGCSETEYWAHETYENLYLESVNYPLQNNDFVYLEPIKVYKMIISLENEMATKKISESIVLESPFWMEHGKSYSLEINLKKIWLQDQEVNQGSGISVNWIENEWTEVSIPIN